MNGQSPRKTVQKPCAAPLMLVVCVFLSLSASSQIAAPKFASETPASAGVIEPLRPVSSAIGDAMSFLKMADGGYVPGRIDGELAAYFTDALMGTDGVRSTRLVAYPARLHSYFIRAFLRYHTYTGEKEWLQRARDLGDWNIAHSTPATTLWPYLAYSTFEKGNPGGHTDKENIQPDKAAFMGESYLMLYEATGEKRYLEAAQKVAGTLVAHQREDGSWPFRVVPETGAVTQDRGGAPVDFVEFFERMLKHDDKAAFRQAHDKALACMISRNVEQGLWGTYHEDVGVKKDSHLSSEPMSLTAIYLFRHAKAHPEYLGMGRRVLKQMEDRLVHTEGHGAAPAPAAAEQNGFEHIMAGHSARYGLALAALYRATGDEDVKRRALSVLNGVTHMQSDNGIFITFFYDVKKQKGGKGTGDRMWFSQHLMSVDYLLESMAVFPQFAPAGENHILGNSVMLRDIARAPDSIGYAAPATVRVTAKLARIPESVTLDGKPLAKLENRPADGADGWTFDPSTSVLALSHGPGAILIRLKNP